MGEARHDAWEEFATRAEIGHYPVAVRMQILTAFNAGWDARKAAQYAGLIENRTQAVDRFIVAVDLATQNKS